MSDRILDRLAQALALNSAERQQLFNLARATSAGQGLSLVPKVRPGIRQLIDSMAEVPALVLDRQTDILAWNRLGHALLGGNLKFEAPDHEDTRPNTTRLLFLDAPTKALYSGWEEEAARAVASLRLVYGRFSQDEQLTALVDDLVAKSPEFAVLWQRHPVENCMTGTKAFRHPQVTPFRAWGLRGKNSVLSA
ncbi:hypothetical protein DEIPH_ctg047orf0014 [Deinococcus phoenicis]|uniref:MmyB-like transcription regulator ligand binding domain-containing protein n=1 Tax=Deinococcus phoenicis TaxID=1476583 RepID=A0A016QMV0_9DEIO|nr:hypothetical protein [Deinococcus phoenicis]EYB67212.1 hypothetical protein DEIPH_ctg047orf0014 [Deinococcus phoenicis]